MPRACRVSLDGEAERPVVDDRSVAKETAAADKLPTLWIAGDSTVKSNNPLRGWGQDLGTFFDPQKINVVNRAIDGRYYLRTFFTEGRWKEIEDALKPGDFVIIQFGHNDVGPFDEHGKLRGPGGPDRQGIRRTRTCHRRRFPGRQGHPHQPR